MVSSRPARLRRLRPMRRMRVRNQRTPSVRLTDRLRRPWHQPHRSNRLHEDPGGPTCRRMSITSPAHSSFMGSGARASTTTLPRAFFERKCGLGSRSDEPRVRSHFAGRCLNPSYRTSSSTPPAPFGRFIASTSPSAPPRHRTDSPGGHRTRFGRAGVGSVAICLKADAISFSNATSKDRSRIRIGARLGPRRGTQDL